MGTIDLGTIDVISTTSNGNSRGLTNGEIEMLRPYFGDNVNYAEITIDINSIILQGSGLSIGGTMYVDPTDYNVDYSTGTLIEQMWFVHEMTHAWQSQQGYDVFLNGLVLLTQGGSQYDYRLDSLNLASFYNYNIESQADMIAHDYAFLNAISDKEFSDAIGIDDYNYLTQGNNIYALMQTVGEFMNSNHDSSWLPNSTFAFDYIRDDIDYTVEKNLIIGSGKIVLSDGTTITYSADIVDGQNIISSTTYLSNGLEDMQRDYFFSTNGDFLGNIKGYDPENALASFDSLNSDSDLLEFFQTQMTLNFIDTAGIYSSAFNSNLSVFDEYSVYSLDNKYYDTWNFSIDNIDELPQVQYDPNTMAITPETYNPTPNYTANNDLFSSLYVSYNDGSVGANVIFQPYDNWASVNGISIGGSFSGDGYGFHVGFSWSFPVVLDLDGDGVELTSVLDSTAWFDIKGDGTLHQTGWVGADDGLLAYDENGDGKITTRREIAFADRTAANDTDLEALRVEFDSNNDGKLDANDTQFAKFKIWQDKDSDGVSDDGELFTLTEMGIESVNLVSMDVGSYMIDGNKINAFTNYTKTDGTIGADDGLLAA